jgi:hypothetical protein
MHMTTTTLRAVVERLSDVGATLEYPGFVCVPMGPERFADFGTANGYVWGGDISYADGRTEGIDMPEVAAASSDVTVIVSAIRAGLATVTS